ncbi:MAG: hypothetical protein IKU65_05270 [Oscillospiraceae bacterium]|nr:hypothetical protein [Oscillospiraceae bacterium]
MSKINIFLEMALVFVLYPLPMLIYRYRIKKKRIEREKAFKICFWYALIPIIVIAFLSRGQMFFSALIIFNWAFVLFSLLSDELRYREKNIPFRFVSGIISFIGLVCSILLFPLFGKHSPAMSFVILLFLFFIIRKSIKSVTEKTEAKRLMKKIAREKEEAERK